MPRENMPEDEKNGRMADVPFLPPGYARKSLAESATGHARGGNRPGGSPYLGGTDCPAKEGKPKGNGDGERMSEPLIKAEAGRVL